MAFTGRTGEPVAAAPPPLEIRSRVWFNPDLRSRNYYVPGVVINIITLVTIMLTAMAIVREKEIGTREQSLVTPIRPLELMIGKTLPFALVGLFDLVLVTVVCPGRVSHSIPGQPPFAVGRCPAVPADHAGHRAVPLHHLPNATAGDDGLVLLFHARLLCSAASPSPIRNMPVPVQMLSYLDPLRYFMEISRNIFLKGTGIAVLWPQMLALLVFGVTILGLSSLRFRKRLD